MPCLLPAEIGQLLVDLFALLRHGEQPLFQPLELRKVSGIGHHQFDVARTVKDGVPRDQHFLIQLEDDGHGVDPFPALEDLFGDRAPVKDAFGLYIGDLPAQDLRRADAGGAGIGLVDEEDLPLSVGDVDAVV